MNIRLNFCVCKYKLHVMRIVANSMETVADMPQRSKKMDLSWDIYAENVPSVFVVLAKRKYNLLYCDWKEASGCLRLWLPRTQKHTGGGRW